MSEDHEPTAEQINQIVFRTVDPEHPWREASVPALTTLLHKICNNDRAKFEEATRLVELFIKQAWIKAKSET